MRAASTSAWPRAPATTSAEDPRDGAAPDHGALVGVAAVPEPVRWGIVSTADINRLVIPGAHASPLVDLVGVASRDRARAEAYAAEWAIPRAYGSYEELLADPAIEAVYISLPEHAPLRVVDPGRRGGQARAVREAALPAPGRGRGRLRRGGAHRPAALGGVHVPPQPADRAARSSSSAAARSASCGWSARRSATRSTTRTTSACGPRSRAAR